MKSFLSIPTFRSMKCLHGVLGTITLSALTSWAIPALACAAGPQTALLQWALFLVFLSLSPVFGLTYRSISSNQY